MGDKEMLDDFCSEIKSIKGELSIYISTLMQKKLGEQDTDNFAKYGQAIDRIYGAAATLGYKEIADYCMAMKTVTYMASDSQNHMGHRKVIMMMIESITLLEEIPECIYDNEKIKIYRSKLLQNVKKVERLNQKEFYSITKKSC